MFLLMRILLLSGEGRRKMPLQLRGVYKALQVYSQVYSHYFIRAVPQGEHAIKN